MYELILFFRPIFDTIFVGLQKFVLLYISREKLIFVTCTDRVPRKIKDLQTKILHINPRAFFVTSAQWRLVRFFKLRTALHQATITIIMGITANNTPISAANATF